MTYHAGITGTGGVAGMGILGMHSEETIGREKIDASHTGGYAATDDIELVAVADVDESKLDTLGEARNIPVDCRYVGHEAMLEAEDLDAVLVCTPPFLHRDHVVYAARSAANPSVIWCEKPIASTVSDAGEMVAVCDDTDTKLTVSHSFRFTDKLRRLRDLVRGEGTLGDVKSVSAQYRMELMRNFTHVLDTLVYLLDARASQVSGHVTGENEAFDALDVTESVVDVGGGGHVVMDDGMFVTVDCTIPCDVLSMTLGLIGTEGKLYMNNDDGEWRYWLLEDGEHVERSLPGIEGTWTRESDYKRSFADATAHAQELLGGDAENYSPGVAATRSLETIVGLYLSRYTDLTVDISLPGPLREVPITSWRAAVGRSVAHIGQSSGMAGKASGAGDRAESDVYRG